MTAPHFWTATLERTIRTFAQALLAVLGAAGAGLLDAPWLPALSTAAMARGAVPAHLHRHPRRPRSYRAPHRTAPLPPAHAGHQRRGGRAAVSGYLHTLVLIGAAAGAACALIAGAWKGIRGLSRFLARGERFLDDWNGTEDRPGVIARLDANEARLERIEHELFPNSGKSLRDGLDRVEAHLTRLEGTRQ